MYFISLKLCRKLMALPLLPAEHIRSTFAHIKPASMTPPLEKLWKYMLDTWINGKIWTPVDWSVYGVAIRTNNDVEGWHTRLNHRSKRGKFFLNIKH